MNNQDETGPAAQNPKPTPVEYETLIANASEGAAITIDNRLVLANRSLADIIGVEPHDLIGKRLDELIHPDDRVVYMDHYFRRLKGTSIRKGIDVRIMDAGGGFHWMRQSDILLNERDNPVLLHLLSDISERKVRQDELEKERHILKTILENIPVMIFFYNRKGETILINQASEQLLGWSLEELWRIKVMEVCYPDEKLRQDVWDFMMEAPPEWRDFPIMTKSGKAFESSWTNIKLSDGSHLGIGLDVSQRKRYERDLIAAAEQLKAGQIDLENKNIALREVLSQIETEKDVIKNRIRINIQRGVLSNLIRLKDQAPPSMTRIIELIEKDLNDIAAPFLDEFSDKFHQLTARELEICRFIRDGLRTKEMAEMLNVSIATIQKHRESIRRKLKLTGKGTNLYAYLQSYADKVDSGTKSRSRSSRRQKR